MRLKSLAVFACNERMHNEVESKQKSIESTSGHRLARNEMPNKSRSVLTLIACFGVLWLGLNDCVAQSSNAVLHQIFRDKAELAESDLTALDQGETLIKLLPARDKREIAMGGAVRVQASAESFLQSFRENMTRKSNPAILEIGKFWKSALT